jgi:hypothetical protein
LMLLATEVTPGLKKQVVTGMRGHLLGSRLNI